MEAQLSFEIQALTAVAGIVGLIMRRDKNTNISMKSIGPVKIPSFIGSSSKSTTMTTENQLIFLVTILCAYYTGICMIIGNLISKSINLIAVADGLCIIIQVTVMTFLIRSGQKSSNNMREVYAFLILANFSIWILEITQVSLKINRSGTATMDLLTLPPIMMSLNRFHTLLIFIQFWRSKA